MSRPNVLWISTHDINPHLGCYAGTYPGAEYFTTPNLDRLAEAGVRFDRTFATNPICGPSRSALMTGSFPTAVGTMHMRTKAVPPPDVRLLSEYFREAGYYVTNTSFTDFQVQVPVTAYDDCSESASWRNRPDGAPFFAAYHGLTTHESQIYLDDEAFAARTSHVGADERHRPEDAPLPPHHPDTPAFRTAWARYADLITEMDTWVGRILADLDEDGLTDDTVVVFWSDHGAGFPRFKRWPYESGLHVPMIMRWPGHLSPGTHSSLVHLMDLGPSMLAVCGIEVPDHLHAVPFLSPDGELLPDTNAYTFGGRDRQGDTEDRSRTVRDTEYRYVRHYHPDRSPMQHNDYPDHTSTWRDLRRLAGVEANQRAAGLPRSAMTPLQRALVAPSKPAPEELYHLVSDPWETTNLVDEPAHRDALDRLRQALDAWLDQYGDLGAIPEDELYESWCPGGRRPRTAAPVPSAGPAGVTATSATPGAHIAWTADPPRDAPYGRASSAADGMGSPGEAIGSPLVDGRHWRLLSPATPAPTDRDVWLRACRLGHSDSEDVRVTRPVRRSDG